MNNQKYSPVENLFILHSFITTREVATITGFVPGPLHEDAIDIIFDNHLTDMEMLSHFTTLPTTPRIVTELHVLACKLSGIPQCICLTYKDTTTPQRGDIL